MVPSNPRTLHSGTHRARSQLHFGTQILPSARKSWAGGTEGQVYSPRTHSHFCFCCPTPSVWNALLALSILLIPPGFSYMGHLLCKALHFYCRQTHGPALLPRRHLIPSSHQDYLLQAYLSLQTGGSLKAEPGSDSSPNSQSLALCLALSGCL